MASTTSSGSGDTDRPPCPPQPKPRPRRRGKHDGPPPQLQFVTATDLSQFKGEHAKRSVRSQAMIHYRNNSGKQRKKSDDSIEGAPAGQAPGIGERTIPVMGQQYHFETREPTASTRMCANRSSDQQYQFIPASTAIWTANEDADDTDGYATSSALTAPANKVVGYENSDRHGEKQMRMLVGKLATHFRIGDGVDPFAAIPQFRNPELKSIQLLRECMRGFSSDSTLIKWLPSMLSHPHILLSSTLCASTWMDMRKGFPGDSKRTVMLKAETIEMIKERLRNPQKSLDDSTLMVILHLLSGEFWGCNEKTLRIHEAGIARFITQRGGMHCLSNQAVAEVAAACCYQCDIFCEAESLPLFRDWDPPQYANVDGTPAVPESPLFCLKSGFATIFNDSRCSSYTYALLCDMRDLTNLFITHNDVLHVSWDIDLGLNTPPSSPPVDYDIKVAGIRERLASMASAYTPGLPMSNDWVYEACRIAALIYTTAIVLRVPFSVAADPRWYPTLSDSGMLTNSYAGGHLLTTPLTEALYETLEKTDTGSIWEDMSGVFFWIAAVGAAAARTPDAMDMTQQPRFRKEAYAVSVRRCLTMTATRAMIVLVFQHPVSVLIAQKNLLKVQELVRGQSTSDSVIHSNLLD